MAYISDEDATLIQEKLKKTFPRIKFDIKTEKHLGTIDVALMSSDIDFSDIIGKGNGGRRINQYHLHRYGQHSELFEKIIKTIKTAGRQYYDNSDIQNDYSDVAFYISLLVGQSDNPYVKKLTESE